MKQTTVIRVTGELCFFFAVLNVFKAFQDWWLPMAVFTAACLALGFLIVRFKNKWARLALSLLPGLSFLLCPLSLLLIFPALAWLYYIAVMTQGNYAMPLDEYRRTYTALMVICLVFVAGNIANSTIFRGQLISPACLVYTFLFLFFGVVAMRRMQMGAEMSRTWKLNNALSVAGFPLLAVGASVLLFLGFRFFEPALRYVAQPIGKFLLWLYGVFFPDGAFQQAPRETLKPEVNALPVGPPESSHGVRGAFDADSMSTTGNLLIEKSASIGAYVLMVILLLLAIYLILQHARRNRPLSETAELYYDETEEDVPETKGRRKKNQRVLGNARQLRRIYQTYLEFINVRGQRINRADTSQEILERDQLREASPEAKRLRELYIAARYGDPKAVTSEQVEEAQACLEKIVKGA